MKRAMLAVFLVSIAMSTGCGLTRRGCNECSGTLGCRPCNLGWQRGGTDYQRFLGHNHLGGHRALAVGGVGGGVLNHAQYGNAQPAGAGEAYGDPTAQIAYPYYTTRGPRDFFVDNPPTIGR